VTSLYEVWSAVDPAPRPTTMPDRTCSTAQSAAARFCRASSSGSAVAPTETRASEESRDTLTAPRVRRAVPEANDDGALPADQRRAQRLRCFPTDSLRPPGCCGPGVLDRAALVFPPLQAAAPLVVSARALTLRRRNLMQGRLCHAGSALHRGSHFGPNPHYRHHMAAQAQSMPTSRIIHTKSPPRPQA